MSQSAERIRTLSLMVRKEREAAGEAIQKMIECQDRLVERNKEIAALKQANTSLQARVDNLLKTLENERADSRCRENHMDGLKDAMRLVIAESIRNA